MQLETPSGSSVLDVTELPEKDKIESLTDPLGEQFPPVIFSRVLETVRQGQQFQVTLDNKQYILLDSLAGQTMAPSDKRDLLGLLESLKKSFGETNNPKTLDSCLASQEILFSASDKLRTSLIPLSKRLKGVNIRNQRTLLDTLEKTALDLDQAAISMTKATLLCLYQHLAARVEKLMPLPPFGKEGLGGILTKGAQKESALALLCRKFNPQKIQLREDLAVETNRLTSAKSELLRRFPKEKDLAELITYCEKLNFFYNVQTTRLFILASIQPSQLTRGLTERHVVQPTIKYAPQVASKAQKVVEKTLGSIHDYKKSEWPKVTLGEKVHAMFLPRRYNPYLEKHRARYPKMMDIFDFLLRSELALLPKEVRSRAETKIKILLGALIKETLSHADPHKTHKKLVEQCEFNVREADKMGLAEGYLKHNSLNCLSACLMMYLCFPDRFRVAHIWGYVKDEPYRHTVLVNQKGEIADANITSSLRGRTPAFVSLESYQSEDISAHSISGGQKLRKIIPYKSEEIFLAGASNYELFLTNQLKEVKNRNLSLSDDAATAILVHLGEMLKRSRHIDLANVIRMLNIFTNLEKLNRTAIGDSTSVIGKLQFLKKELIDSTFGSAP